MIKAIDSESISSMEDLAAMALEGVKTKDTEKVIIGAMNLLIQIAFGAEDKESALELLDHIADSMMTACEQDWDSGELIAPEIEKKIATRDSKRAIH